MRPNASMSLSHTRRRHPRIATAIITLALLDGACRLPPSTTSSRSDLALDGTKADAPLLVDTAPTADLVDTAAEDAPPDSRRGDSIDDTLRQQLIAEVQAYLTAEAPTTDLLKKLDGAYATIPFGVLAAAIRTFPKTPPLPAAGIHEVTWTNPFTKRPGSYSLYVPPNVPQRAKAGAQDRFALILFLHGAGGSGGGITANAAIRQAADDHDALLVAPTDDAATCDWSESEACMSQVVRLVQLLKRRYPIDDRRVVLTGFSMGGRGSFSVGVAYPEPYCGVIPLAGTIGAVFDDPDLTLHERYCCPHLQNIESLRLRYFAGDQDSKLLLYQNRGCALCLPASTAEHEYVEVAGQGHVFFTTRWRQAITWAITKPRVDFPKTLHRNLAVQASGITPGGIFLHETLKVPQYWADPQGRADASKSGALLAEVSGQTLTLTTRNLRGITLYLADDLLDLDLPVQVIVDGKKVHDGLVPRDRHVLLEQARLRSERAMLFAAKIVIPL